MAQQTLTTQIAELLSKHTHEDGIAPTPIVNLYLYRFSSNTPSERGIPGPALCFVAQGGKEVVLGERSIVQQAGAYMLTPVDLPATGNVIESSTAKPFLGFRFDLDLAEIGGMALQFDDALKRNSAYKRDITIASLPSIMSEAFVRLIRLLDTPEDIPILAPLLRQEILYRLFKCGHEGIFRDMAKRGGSIHRLTLFINWLKKNSHRTISGEQMAAQANMSGTVLYESFKSVTGMSPLQFHKQLRLQEARRILVTGNSNAALAAMHVGYKSTSQFSRDYTRLFGRPPARDLKQYRTP